MRLGRDPPVLESNVPLRAKDVLSHSRASTITSGTRKPYKAAFARKLHIDHQGLGENLKLICYVSFNSV